MRRAIVSLLFAISLFGVLGASRVAAQVQRTFVSGLGSDSNPCSPAAPCRNFASAISQTNPGGEVVVLDSAGYGPFSITQTVSIIAPPEVYAGISVFSGDGIEINAGGSDVVILRGLTVNNQGSTGNGIVLNGGSQLHLEGCVINGFRDAGLNLVTAGLVEATDSVLRNNFIGIQVLPAPGTETALTIDHTRFEANTLALYAREGSKVTVTNSVVANGVDGLGASSASSGSVRMNVETCVVSGNRVRGIVAIAQGTGAVQVNVARCVISDNLADGIQVESDATGVATLRFSSTTVTGNGTGLSNLGSPALLLSRGDNTIEGNTTNTSGTIGSYSAK